MQGEEGGEGDTPAEGEAKKKSGKPEKRLRNQFNFSERASQTLNNPYRVGSKMYMYHSCTKQVESSFTAPVLAQNNGLTTERHKSLVVRQ